MNKNKDKAIIIYRDIFFHFTDNFFLDNINEEDKKNNQFKILLVEFKEISERSYMFHCSKYLEEFQSSEINKIEFKNNDAKSICSEDEL